MEHSEWTRIFHTEAGDLLHGHNWNLQFDSSIEPERPQYGWKEYIRNTSARFQCAQCRRGWPSNRVMVLFHMRLIGTEGTVKVRRFRQNCKTCDEAPMVDPSITSENIATLMKNLVKKIRIKCYFEDLGQNNYYPVRFDVNNPHEPAHCEACRLGICTSE